ncbi:MAG: matrixin family metalloprotease [Bryobacterales bacterium]|nr:matrixin family metalloprotease [Bryobacterales bacterium]
MAVIRKSAALLLAALIVSGTASAYTYWVRYPNRTSPFTPIPRKYDLNSLWNNTVYYYISDATPTLAETDSKPGVISQIRAAARVWNDVGTSSLRIAFGGLYSEGVSSSTPAIEVAFSDDIPPGLIALTGVSEAVSPDTAGLATLVPISGARISLPRDLQDRPSFSEGFFQTMVHEFGHALGLQHTLTSSVMSTEITRGTSKAKPLAIDDIAGISGLYPTTAYLGSTGSITGRVAINGDGVNMASVVAISFSGLAISALTNPDGTYRIDGIPVGSGYMVYAHPLPPALSGESFPAAIEPALDTQGVPFTAGAPFYVQFYPATTNWAQATQFSITPGKVVDGVDFNVTRRTSPPSLHSVQTYNFPGQIAVKPPYLSRNTYRPFIVASGIGLSPSVGVGLLNSSEDIAPDGVKAYPYGSGYVQIDIQATTIFSAEGPRHLIFSRDNDLYILPAGFNLVQRTPPVISSITPSVDEDGRRMALVDGTNLGADTRIWFDGVEAAVIDSTGPLKVLVPPGAGLHSNVAAFNSDGQSSLFMQADQMPGYDYDPDGTPAAALSTGSLPAGTEALVQIDTSNMNLVRGVTKLGFGSPDVVVRRMWVVEASGGGATRILANVAVAPNAPAGAIPASIVTGLRVWEQPLAFQILPPDPRQLSLAIPSSDPVTPGSTVSLAVMNLSAAQAAAGVTAALNGTPIPVVTAFNGLVAVQIPADFPIGPAVLRIVAAGQPSLPYGVSIDPQPPVIAVVTNATTQTPVDALHPAKAGDVLTLTVSNLAGAKQSGDVTPDQIHLKFSGFDCTASNVEAIAATPGFWHVSFQVGSNVPAGSPVPLTITSPDGRTSLPVFLTIQAN